MWQAWQRLRAPMATSPYSRSKTMRDWSKAEPTPLQAMLDPQTNNLYVNGPADLLPSDRLRDPNGDVWLVDDSVPTAPDVNLVAQSPVQQWANPLTGWVPGTVVHLVRSTP